MTKKVLLTFLVIWLFSNTGSASNPKKHMDHQPSIKRL